MAHIEKPRRNKDGTWSVRVTHYVSGHKQHTPLSGFASQREALRAAKHEADAVERAKYLAEAAELDPLAVGRTMTGGELVEEWVRLYVNIELRGRTCDDYKALAPRYFTPFWGDKVIANQSRAQGLEYRAWLLERVRESMAQRGQLDPDDDMAGVQMVNRTLTMARSIWSFARDNRWIEESPLRKVRDLDYTAPVEHVNFVVYPELVEAIRSVISRRCEPWVRARDQLMVSLRGHVGLRGQDLWDAQWWQALDPETHDVRYAFIVPQRLTGSGRKSRNAEREPQLYEEVRRELRAYYLMMGRPNLDELMFPNHSKSAPLMSRNWLRSHWRPALWQVLGMRTETAELAVENETTGERLTVELGRWHNIARLDKDGRVSFTLTPHMLRRCVASMLGEALEPDVVALEALGHNQRENKTLIRYYRRALNSRRASGEPPLSVDEQIARARALYFGRSDALEARAVAS